MVSVTRHSNHQGQAVISGLPVLGPVSNSWPLSLPPSTEVERKNALPTSSWSSASTLTANEPVLAMMAQLPESALTPAATSGGSKLAWVSQFTPPAP